ncbi:MAG: NYN domain-containing protein [Tissierellia bacterium]|nr:NYN domain-containing protein [Tissierellia bacterium]
MQSRKKHYLIVDGYNVIYAWDDLKKLQRISLDEARELLIDCMSELASITGEIIIVVFDSYNVKSPTVTIENRKGIEIVFTKEYQTADSYIEKLVSNGGKNDIFKVASSDSAIQSLTFGKGASRISSNELEFYYNTQKDRLIDKSAKKISKTNTNLVSLDEQSLRILEEIENKFEK